MGSDFLEQNHLLYYVPVEILPKGIRFVHMVAVHQGNLLDRLTKFSFEDTLPTATTQHLMESHLTHHTDATYNTESFTCPANALFCGKNYHTM